MGRSSREVREDGRGSRGNGEKGWKEEKMSQGRKAAGLRVWRNQQQERKKEAGLGRQGMVKRLGEAKKRVRRDHLPPCSWSLGGQGCW